MSAPFKKKPTGLAAFARAGSESSVVVKAAPLLPSAEAPAERRSESPRHTAQEASRLETADPARFPLPSGHIGTPRKANGEVVGPGLLQPAPRMTRAASTSHRGPAGPRDRLATIFSGSQLGDDFMNSAVSTPDHEPAADQGRDEEATPHPREERRHAIPTRYMDARGQHPPVTAPSFVLDEKLQMTVVNAIKGSFPHQMTDGFQDDIIPAREKRVSNYANDGSHGPWKAATQPQLPFRQARIKRLPGPGPRVSRENPKVRRRSPSVESAEWQGLRRRDGPPPEAKTNYDANNSPVEELGPASEYGEAPSAPGLRDDGRRRVALTSAQTGDARHRQPKRRRESLDYDDNLLSGMSYQDLQDEPFDDDPTVARGRGGPEAAIKLPLKLEQFRQQRGGEQTQMFAAMSMEDWEASGDWFVDQFADMMKKLREARRSKRLLVRAFEDEAARREEAVRHRSQTIDRKLARMRQDGLRVVEDKNA
ncbi:hypothetical protein DCS_00649 [Drechmeria coniospora]|uniref:Extracellular mutant protein 11 C-terminal domain-containing protein n=1 Tax=Drechmeria coniospora TaxID=98403 RepID=A0A151GQY5_DRECN|nr:hypothetical protein DCS_00649 [Drechmeria coniospora]KYK59519.1 hypothetical protein DCS_00649 [Drechmeria coniospora]ODA76240.1 hypothetical protein RJ55_08085 [Drechmeria coniospora]